MPYQKPKAISAVDVTTYTAVTLLVGLATYLMFNRASPQTVAIKPLSPSQYEKINATFDIFIINLDKDPDRLQRITRRLQKNRLNFKRFTAIDGRKLDRNQLVKNNVITNSFAKVATPGEIGCVLSHTYLWKQSLQSKKPYIVIFEDDLIIQDDLANKLYQLSKSIDTQDFDLLLLGRDLSTRDLCDQQVLKPHMCRYYKTNIYPTIEPDHSTKENFITPPYSGSTFAYLVPKNKLGKLIGAYKKPIDDIADRGYWNPKNHITIKAVHPIWYRWNDNESAFGGSRTRYHHR